MFFQILLRLTRLCVQEMPNGKKPRKHEQRLLRNMGAHAVILELLQIPYDKVIMKLLKKKKKKHIHYLRNCLHFVL